MNMYKVKFYHPDGPSPSIRLRADQFTVVKEEGLIYFEKDNEMVHCVPVDKISYIKKLEENEA